MKTILEVKNLTKAFNGFNAIDNLNFSAEEGKILGLLGPNGAGKTTAIRTIATVIKPTSGTATVCGFDILKDPENVRKNIGVLTTDIGVYERFSGRENLEYFGSLYEISGPALKDRINELSKLLSMEEFIDRRAGTYSTGMKQKLAIARSIIHNPYLVVFDEPTSGLDVIASQTVLNVMRHAREAGKCVVFSTHHMIEAEKLCDKVVILYQGKLIANDTIAYLKDKTGTRDLEDAFLKLISQ